MRLAMKSLSLLRGMLSALLLGGLVLCNFGAQADVRVPYLKIGGWSLEYLEVGKFSGCLAAAQFPDQTVFQMVRVQSGTEKAWIIFISNPRWNAWLGKRKELRLQLVTDWPTTKPWPYTFSISGESKILSTTDASVEFIKSVADASKVEIMTDNNERLASVDMKDSAAAIRAIVNCVSEHPPRRAQSPSSEPETTISGTGFFVAQNRLVTNNHVVEWMHKSHSSAISRKGFVHGNDLRPRRHK